MVIGVGNRLRGDDALGPEVVRRLEGRVPEDVRLIIHEGDGSALLSLWQDCREAHLVDASQSGDTPGNVRVIEAARETLPAGFFRYSSHQFGLAEAIETARALGTLPDAVTVYAAEGGCFAPGESLSAEVDSAATALADAILKRLSRG